MTSLPTLIFENNSRILITRRSVRNEENTDFGLNSFIPYSVLYLGNGRSAQGLDGGHVGTDQLLNGWWNSSKDHQRAPTNR